MVPNPTPDDPFGLAGLGNLFDDDTHDDILFGDDDDDSTLLTAAAAEVGLATSTTPVSVDVARASVFGFDERLAVVVLADAELLRQLRRHWQQRPISSVVQNLAAQPNPLGRLHAELIAQAGPAQDGHASGGQVIAGPWTYQPRLARRQAAKSGVSEQNSYTERSDARGLTVVQTANPNGDAVIEITFAPGAAQELWIVRIVVGTQDKLVLCRARGAELVARTVVHGDTAWAANSIFAPVSADDAPGEVVARIADTVRAAPIAETNLWRRLRRTLPDQHPVAIAIDAGLR